MGAAGSITAAAVLGLDWLRLLAAAGAGIAVVLLGIVFLGPERGVDPDVATRLGSYAPGPTATGWRARIPWLRRFTAGAERAAERRGLLQAVNSLLEQSNLPLSAGEAMLGSLVLAVVGGVVVWLAAGSVFLGMLIGIGIPLVLAGLVQAAAGRERRRFEGQLPDTLNLMATSLRAGYSLLQSLESVSGRAAAPTSREFGRAMSEIRLGREVPDALRGIASRMGSVDFGWAVMAIEIQRDVGGNLAEVLTTASSTLVDRTRLRREARALTAEGRLTAVILSAVPVLLFGFLFATNRDYLDPLIDEPFGRIALVLTAALMGVGVFWLRRIVNIEV